MLYKHWRSDHPEYLTEMEQGVDPGNEQGEAEESAIPDSKEHHTYWLILNDQENSTNYELLH